MSARLIVLADHPSLHRGFATIGHQLACHLHANSRWQVEYWGYYRPDPDWRSPGYKVVDLEPVADDRPGRTARLRGMFAGFGHAQETPSLLLCIGTLFDLKCVHDALDSLSLPEKPQTLAYTPVDYAPIPVAFTELAARFDAVVPYSRFAREAMLDCARRAGTSADNIRQPIGHGVDTNLFRPLADAERRSVRAKLFGLEEDELLIGFFGRNSSHKRADIVLRLFHAAATGHYGRCPRCSRVQIGRIGAETAAWLSDAVCRSCGRHGLEGGKAFARVRLYLHTDLSPEAVRHASGGRNLALLAQDLGIGHRVIFNRAIRIGRGEDRASLARRMAACDLHLMPSDCAGWELTILETGACGVANLITDYATPPEYAAPFSLLVPPSVFIAGMDLRALIDADLALGALLQLIERPQARKTLGSRGPAAAADYAWPGICRKWQALVDTLATTVPA